MSEIAATPPPSERQQVAQRIATFICENNLAQVFGGDVQQSADKRYYGVGLSIARLLDGEVRVYSPSYIYVGLDGPMVHGAGQRVYGSADDAIRYLDLLCVKCRGEEAEQVPQKQTKRR